MHIFDSTAEPLTLVKQLRIPLMQANAEVAQNSVIHTTSHLLVALVCVGRDYGQDEEGFLQNTDMSWARNVADPHYH